MKNLIKIAVAATSLAFSANVFATPLDFWDDNGWTQFADDEGMAEGPGVGGQAFDTEYLYYKTDGNTLYLGLQTGFDVVDGTQVYGRKDYYGGDFALSFDGDVTIGDESTYEYGVDFGLYTEGYYSGIVDMHPDPLEPGDVVGIDDAGLYSVSSWSNEVYSGHHISDPFAMDGGTKVGDILTDAGSEGDSFFRTVSFNMAGLGTEVDLHWTMSCGNDNINGGFSVPEPGIMSLMGMGLLGLVFVRRRKLKA